MQCYHRRVAATFLSRSRSNFFTIERIFKVRANSLVDAANDVRDARCNLARYYPLQQRLAAGCRRNWQTACLRYERGVLPGLGQGSAAVLGWGFGLRLAASRNAQRDARRTRRRDVCATARLYPIHSLRQTFHGLDETIHWPMEAESAPDRALRWPVGPHNAPDHTIHTPVRPNNAPVGPDHWLKGNFLPIKHALHSSESGKRSRELGDRGRCWDELACKSGKRGRGEGH